MKTTETATICPHCGIHHECASHLEDVTPQPGSVSICFNCGKIALFTETLQLRLVTRQEFDEWSDEEKRAILAHVRALAVLRQREAERN